ncbi:MAG: FRG domain-containing protein [Clostridiales Family XIII bacterium]|jgi:hypothetical protein|nr:FRG domain-containing protein [Clostridiales Family XIII bacterium]
MENGDGGLVHGSPFEQLSFLQHHGAKTRMLDVSRNPLIALYFAVENMDATNDSVVYVYSDETSDKTSEKKSILKYDSGDTATLKAALHFIDEHVVLDFIDSYKSCERTLITEDDCKNLMEGASCDRAKDNIKDILSFIGLLNQEANRSHDRFIKIKEIYDDITKAHIVLATKSTSRITRQDGAFIMPAFETKTKTKGRDCINFDVVRESIDNLKRHEFQISGNCIKEIKSGNCINEIKNELALLGINSGSVYPDIEHQSEYLIDFVATPY